MRHGYDCSIAALQMIATMADLHRAGRYDRMSDDVLTLTGQGPPGLPATMELSDDALLERAGSSPAPASIQSQDGGGH